MCSRRCTSRLFGELVQLLAVVSQDQAELSGGSVVPSARIMRSSPPGATA